MTYILYALGASSLVNLILLYLVGKVVIRNSDNIDRLKHQQQEEEEKKTGLISP